MIFIDSMCVYHRYDPNPNGSIEVNKFNGQEIYFPFCWLLIYHISLLFDARHKELFRTKHHVGCMICSATQLL